MEDDLRWREERERRLAEKREAHAEEVDATVNDADEFQEKDVVIKAYCNSPTRPLTANIPIPMSIKTPAGKARSIVQNNSVFVRLRLRI